MWYLRIICFFAGYFFLSLQASVTCQAENFNNIHRDNDYFNGFESVSHNKLFVINSGDTVVFDFSQAICTPAYVQVPVFFLSDDIIFAVDFALKFNPSEFSYNSFINHKPYLNNSMSFNLADSTLRFSTFSMIPIDNNSPLISVRFNVMSSMIGISSFNEIQTWLNGDDCSFKSVNLPSAPPIVPGGITSIGLGDSVLLSISPPLGHTYLWSTGASVPSIWVSNAGTYSVAVTNPAGCTSTSFITINSYNPLPVELLEFKGFDSDDGNHIEWITASELDNDYFMLEHSDDAFNWEAIARKTGAGTSGNMNYYEYIHSLPDPGLNYYRLKQYDFNGSEQILPTIKIDHRPAERTPSIIIYPNPAFGDTHEFAVSISSPEQAGLLTISDNTGKMVFNKAVEMEQSGNKSHILFLRLPQNVQSGIYSVKWIDAYNTVVTRLVIY